MTIYGSLFVTKHGSSDSGVWLETLQDLTPKALESGIARLKTAGGKFLEFPPNCLQFRALCLAFYDDLKLPSVTEAYQEIRRHAYDDDRRWTHPVIRFTASRLPKGFLQQDHNQHDFQDIYDQVCHLLKQGHPLPEIDEPELGVKPIDRAVGRTHLQRLKELLTGGKSDVDAVNTVEQPETVPDVELELASDVELEPALTPEREPDAERKLELEPKTETTTMTPDAMTLTDWWLALRTDLARLAPLSTLTDSPPWQAVQTMINAGMTIEHQLVNALSLQSTIETAARQLSEHDEGSMLPEVTTAQQWLFALMYYQHLKRFNRITQGNFLLLQGIQSERPRVSQAAHQLHQRLTDYLASSAHQAALHDAFPSLSTYSGHWFEKVNAWLSGEVALDIRLAAPFNTQHEQILTQMAVLPETTLSTVMDEFQHTLVEHEKSLRHLAACQQVVAVLQQPQTLSLLHEETPAALEELTQTYPEIAASWPRIINHLPPATYVSQLVDTTSHYLRHVGESSYRLLRHVSPYRGVGSLFPDVLGRSLQAGATYLSRVSTPWLPLTQPERRQHQLLAAAEREITLTLPHLTTTVSLTLHDVQRQSARELELLADKMALRRRLFALEQQLVHYQHHHAAHWKLMAQQPVLAWVVDWLTASLLRVFVATTVCLMADVRRLQQAIGQLHRTLPHVTEPEQLNTLAHALQTNVTRLHQQTAPPVKTPWYSFFNQTTPATHALYDVMGQQLQHDAPTLGLAS